MPLIISGAFPILIRAFKSFWWTVPEMSDQKVQKCSNYSDEPIQGLVHISG